ncbi:MAG: GAF domain-containing sensor histidine kinase [Burkholderiales bacterium]|nr:GAF domain-containing sensor histidine kinase [Burkholderiales bacterium]
MRLPTSATSREGRATLLFDLSKSAYVDSGYFEIAAENIALTAAKGLGLARASVWLTEDQCKRIRCAGLVQDGVVQSIDGVTLYESDYPRYFAAIRDNRLVVAETVADHPDMAELAESYAAPLGIVSMLDVPFRVGGRMAGVICCEDRVPRNWPDAEQHFVMALTEVAARALAAEARQRAEDALKLANTGIEAQVAERTAALRAALDQLQQAQEQLIQVEKMAALGALVAGVAHEINTPLGISVTAASHFRAAVADVRHAAEAGRLTRDAFQRFLADTEDSAVILLRNLERAAQLVQSFKRVAVHQSDETVSEFDLRGALCDLVHSMSPACKRENITVEMRCDEGIIMRSYVGALEQAISNLIINAMRHAYSAGGRIAIRATTIHSGVRIELRDEGAGIAPELLPRIFDPFVTTKRNQGGTGLGLHIVLNLVHYRLKGRIEVDSIQGSGTVFTLTLPVNVEDDPEVHPPLPLALAPGA